MYTRKSYRPKKIDGRPFVIGHKQRGWRKLLPRLYEYWSLEEIQDLAPTDPLYAARRKAFLAICSAPGAKTMSEGIDAHLQPLPSEQMFAVAKPYPLSLN